MARLILFREVLRRTATSRKRILQWMREGLFPAPVSLPDDRRLWRLSEVVAWIQRLPRVEIGQRPNRLEIQDSSSNRPTLDESRLPELARDMLEVLRAHPGQWVAGVDLSKGIGGDVSPHTGHFRRCVAVLRNAGLIESCKQGYRAIQGTRQGQDED